jgi:putative membrane protein
MHFLARLLINAAALWVATDVVPGIAYQGRWTSLLVVALVFGVLNASVRPLLKVLTFPLLILSLGLFTLVINALMLWLTGWVSDWLALGFHVAGFWAAFWGGLVVSIVSLLLSIFVRRRRGIEADVT